MEEGSRLLSCCHRQRSPPALMRPAGNSWAEASQPASRVSPAFDYAAEVNCPSRGNRTAAMPASSSKGAAPWAGIEPSAVGREGFFVSE